MPSRAVVFVSEACDGLGGHRLSEIMGDAADFNRRASVTGVILFDGRRFLGYMDGPPDGLDVAFLRAVGATSHWNLIEIARGRVGQSRLPYWSMRCISVSPPELVQLVGADWTGFPQRGQDQVPPASAMEMLVALAEPFAESA
ncbi:BLUF domain-containing protein [Stenotrophomonas maltophilia]|uniref:BLUF domain-containing protein n=1 Tax=Stenotrophomonas maltophilia TaxID=40324 RepID=UPI0021C16447|nr:BLUF domain-containing protein [Stenotrophomonas maltophilia]UXL28965.1 BLUF domain-containing protein [Stenotrophomonas maltophilia]